MTRLVGAPGEFFVELGLRSSAVCLRPTTVLELTNDSVGYIPSALIEGGHTNQSRYAPGFGELIVETAAASSSSSN